jgi:hypothetical protein
MNWKLVAQLSLFGLAMGIATVFVISSRVEPLVWLVVLAISAYLIATRVSARYFLHGLAVGVANSVWVTASHIMLLGSYIANHPREAAMMASMPAPASPRLMMALVGPVIGVVSGVVLGVLAVIAAKVVGGRGASMPPG